LDAHSWLAFALVVVAGLLLVLAAAAEAAGVFAARFRSRPVGARHSTRSQSIQQFIAERERLLSGLAVCRLLCVVTAGVAVFSVVARRTGISLLPAAATVVLTVIGAGILEAIPRVIVSHDPERWSEVLSPLLALMRILFRPAAYLVGLPAHALLRLAPFRPSPRRGAEEDEELLRLVEMEESQGGLEQDERAMIRAVFQLEDTTAREVMVPRIDITAIEVGASLNDVAELVALRGISRIPLYEDSLDNVLGVIYAKDGLKQLALGDTAVDLRAIARPAYFVPESKRIDELLTELRSRRVHIALLVDEYGGTAGLLTIEDLVEQIVGEIDDEYDRPAPAVELEPGGDALVSARESVDILKELFDVEVEGDDYDTLGGLIIQRLGRIPLVNDAVEVDGLRLQVLSVAGRRLGQVRISRIAPAGSGEAEN
jgi:putative hemolysin